MSDVPGKQWDVWSPEGVVVFGEVEFIDPSLGVKVAGNGPMPTRAHDDDAGFDLYYSGTEPLDIPPQEVMNVPTGVAMEWPAGWWSMIVGRSSIFQKGLLVNVGIIDSGWRGELLISVRNLNNTWYTVQPGDRLAQIIPMAQYSVQLERVEKLSDHPRGHNGFGSSGI